ncbi:hypothetical protein NJ7G_2393 [Natrinema sp. J7-2]|nr:hypothetical protein NJ7G_2393 [Natrinema sp. J7-2]
MSDSTETPVIQWWYECPSRDVQASSYTASVDEYLEALDAVEVAIGHHSVHRVLAHSVSVLRFQPSLAVPPPAVDISVRIQCFCLDHINTIRIEIQD